jgi:hypothetical protein
VAGAPGRLRKNLRRTTRRIAKDLEAVWQAARGKRATDTEAQPQTKV